MLAGVEPDAMTSQLGRLAGELLGRTGRDGTIDAIVATTAESLGQRVGLLTGDPDDLRALTAMNGDGASPAHVKMISPPPAFS